MSKNERSCCEINWIDSLAHKSAKITASGISDYSKLVAVMSKYKHKKVTLKEKDILSMFQYGYQAIYGELFKTTIVLLIAWLLHIFESTIIVMLAFSILRSIAGGKHLHSSTKCLIFTTILIICTGYFANIYTLDFSWYNKVMAYIGFGIILELLSTTEGFENVLKKLDGEIVENNSEKEQQSVDIGKQKDYNKRGLNND